MNKKSIAPFSATVTVGLEYGYDKLEINKSEIIGFIQEYQNKLIEEKRIHLSCSVTECSIVLSGQFEPHLKLGFINYPKFPLEHDILKTEIEELTEKLMEEFHQNRIVIEYLDETVMLEINIDKIDGRIIRTSERKQD